VSPIAEEAAFWNRCRFRPADAGGHYESYFVRANHEEQPLAFWIRYTIFVPRGRPADAQGELWAVFFDGVRGMVHGAKSDFPLGTCKFSRENLDVEVGAARLSAGRLEGAVQGAANLRWSLRYATAEPPLLLLPRPMYTRGFPKAKAVVSAPNAVFEGTLEVDDTAIPIDAWRGSQNHNWGTRHTDEYAWGQVAGFDDAPQAFLECSSARLRIGPLRTPWLTLLVLRLDGEELRLNSTSQALRSRQELCFFDWHFESRRADLCIRGRIHAPASTFVALPYRNPPGGTKTCLNSKLAACEITVERPGRPPRTLISRQRAAFEILTDGEGHGVPFAV
jgi:hypothetical protein